MSDPEDDLYVRMPPLASRKVVIMDRQTYEEFTQLAQRLTKASVLLEKFAKADIHVMNVAQIYALQEEFTAFLIGE